MTKTKEPLSPVSPDGVYSLAWDSRDRLEVFLRETGDRVLYLEDNMPRWIKSAAFSRDMRRIYLFNGDGTLGVYYTAPGSRNWTPPPRNIVEYLNDNYYDDVELFRLFRFGKAPSAASR